MKQTELKLLQSSCICVCVCETINQIQYVKRQINYVKEEKSYLHIEEQLQNDNIQKFY